MSLVGDFTDAGLEIHQTLNGQIIRSLDDLALDQRVLYNPALHFKKGRGHEKFVRFSGRVMVTIRKIMLLQKWQTNRIFEAIKVAASARRNLSSKPPEAGELTTRRIFELLHSLLTHSLQYGAQSSVLDTCLSQENLMSKAEMAS